MVSRQTWCKKCNEIIMHKWSLTSLGQNLVLENEGFAVTFAKKYIGNGLNWDELLSASNEGLIYAVARFDPTYGFSFSTYAHNWCFKFIVKALKDNYIIIRPYKLRKIIKIITNNYDDLLDKDLLDDDLLDDDLLELNINKLKLKEQEVIKQYLKGKSLKNIAKELKISYPTVRRRNSNAVQHLKEFYLREMHNG